MKSAKQEKADFSLQICAVCKQSTAPRYSGWEGDNNSEYELRSCSGCGSLYTWPLPSDEVIGALYKSNFNYKWYQGVYEEKLREAHVRAQELSEFLGRNVLDFGGGFGYLSEALRARGYNAVTYDPALNDQTIEPDKYAWNTVLALHVLEHSNKPEELLSKMASYMRHDGLLILAVPNAESQGYRRRGMSWTWAQPPLIHIFHFTAKGLRELLAQQGFDVLEIRFSDRWDANYLADVVMPGYCQKLIDGLWGTRPFKYIPAIRRSLIRMASNRRWRLLARSHELNIPPEHRAEILVVARRGRQTKMER